MSVQDDFLQALAENEDDTTTRSIYADWLDEHGDNDEADRQRKWPAAKAWLVRFWREHAKPDDDFEYEEPDDGNPYSFLYISYETLLNLGRQAIESADERGIGFFCGANETLMDALRANRREFWKNWSIVTGIPLPPNVAEKSYFSCSC